MSKYWNMFKKTLVKSISSIDDNYFTVQRHVENPGDGPSIEQKLLEQVYTYELYHQLRLQLGNALSYTLHGELDKRWQKIMSEIGLADSADAPNFVFHNPGQWRRQGHTDNLVIMDVRSASRERSSLLADIKELLSFAEGEYCRHGILLIHGPEPRSRQPLATLAEDARRIEAEIRQRIEQEPDVIWEDDPLSILWQPSAGQEPQLIYGRNDWPELVAAQAANEAMR